MPRHDAIYTRKCDHAMSRMSRGCFDLGWVMLSDVQRSRNSNPRNVPMASAGSGSDDSAAGVGDGPVTGGTGRLPKGLQRAKNNGSFGYAQSTPLLS